MKSGSLRGMPAPPSRPPPAERRAATRSAGQPRAARRRARCEARRRRAGRRTRGRALAERGGVDVADRGDLQLRAGEHAPGVGFWSSSVMVGTEVSVPLFGRRRDGRERPRSTRCGRRCAGIGGLAAERRHDLARARGGGVGLEPRLVERQPQKLEALVLPLAQTAFGSSRGSSRGVTEKRSSTALSSSCWWNARESSSPAPSSSSDETM